ncbi:PAS domain S-box protein [Leptolyngbya sp. PCC 6406]|uniref:PAS domain-containing sensor histidine kinase n=1 Tax=Leptolyngbya sp. PCC 6406 TaxID=1173264 RepID=UPI0002AC8742|nr:PAS domain S-box protein [Leptolyngbya sp. PCC 6406]
MDPLASSVAVGPGSHGHYLQMLLEHTPAAIALFDRAMRYVMASRRWLEDYGLEDCDIIGQSHYEVFPEIGDDWKAIHQRCLQGSVESCDEDSFPRSDGTVDWLRWEVRPWHEPSGDIGGIVIFTEVITARKQAELALVTANAALETEVTQRTATVDGFFNLAVDMLCIAGLDGYFKRVNPTFEQVLGYTQAELLAVPFLSFVHPEDYPATLVESRKLSEGHKVISFENRYRCKDGSYRCFSWKCAPDLETGFIYCTVQDATDHIATETALRKQAQLLDQVQGAIVSTSLEGVITSWSKGATALYGYTAEEVIGQNGRFLYPEGWDDYLLNDIFLPLQQHGQLEIETTNLHKAGYRLDVLLSLSLEKDDNGNVIGIIAYTTDISDRKQAEQRNLDLKNLYEQILDTIPDMVLCKGPESRLLYGNKAFRDYYGMTNDQLLGLIDAPHSKPDYTQQYIKDDAYVFRTGNTLQMEESIVRHDGEERLFLTNKAAVFDSHGEVIQTVGISRDISSQKASEIKLRDQEQFLRSVFDGSEHSIFVVDVVGQSEFRFSGWNRGAEKEIGLTRDQVLGKTPVEIFGDGQGLQFQVSYQRCVEGRNPVNYEEWVVLDDQKTWWFTTLNPLADDAGNIYRLVGTTTNITSRKRAEEELRSSQKFLKLLLDTIPLDVFWKDKDSVYLGCNAQAATLSDLASPEEIVGKTDYDLPWALTEAEIYRQRDREILDSGQSILGLSESITYPDGRKVWLNSNKVPLRDAEDNVIGVLCTTEDISDRKQAEIQLQEYAERQALFNQLTSQIRNSLDLDTVIESTIQAIHRRLEIDHCAFAWYCPEADPPVWDMIKEARSSEIPSSLGTFPAAWIGPINTLLLNQEVLCVDDAETYGEPIHRAFLQQVKTKSEILLPIRNQSGRVGVIICVHKAQVRPWSASEVELLTAVGDQLAIAIDQAELYAQSRQKSTELEHTLKELQRTQVQMIQAEKMSGLGQLVAGVAHEINNPVNFIYGNLNHAQEYTENLLEVIQLYQAQFPEPGEDIEVAIEDLELEFLAEDLPKMLTSMKVGAERIRTIVSSLRVFSRMDEADMKAVDIHEGIDSTLMILHNRLKPQHNRPEIQVIKHYGDLSLVECYAGQLNQVFMNILSNAIDALEDAMGRHSLAKPQITVRTRVEADGQVSIAIADNGLGIPDKIRSRIFDPFFTTKPVGKGTGMGLSISYQIITEKHGGQLICQSNTVEGGTEFRIAIPQRQKP